MTSWSLEDVEIIHAVAPGDVEHIRRLFRTYANWLDVDLCFQNFETELAELPGFYAPPHGRLLLAKAGDEIAGCVGLRPLGDGICEMKRLWVEPSYTGLGIGRSLAEAIVLAGHELGYRAIRLDTMPKRLQAAQHIYQTLGFKQIPHYYENPLKDAVMYEFQYNE